MGIETHRRAARLSSSSCGAGRTRQGQPSDPAAAGSPGRASCRREPGPPRQGSPGAKFTGELRIGRVGVESLGSSVSRTAGTAVHPLPRRLPASPDAVLLRPVHCHFAPASLLLYAAGSSRGAGTRAGASVAGASADAAESTLRPLHSARALSRRPLGWREGSRRRKGPGAEGSSSKRRL